MVNPQILVPLYGAIIVGAALKSLIFKQSASALPNWIAIPVLLGAGVIHGMFASGGALLVVYLVAKFSGIRIPSAPMWLPYGPS